MSNDDDAIESIEVTPGQRPVVRLSKDTTPPDATLPASEETSAPPSSASDDVSDDSSLSLPSWLRKGVVESVAPIVAEEAEGDVTADDVGGSDADGESSQMPSETVDSIEKESDEDVAPDGQSGSDETGVAVSTTEDVPTVPMGVVSSEPAPSPVFATSLTSGQTMATVSEWARKWNVDDDPYVSGLVAALGRRDNMTMWASLDPMEMLPDPEIRSGGLMKRIARVLTVIRNVLVFVPVALTWLSIQHATEAFGKYLFDNPNLETSFLQFWQSPGDAYLADHWRIQDIARLDAFIIFLIIAATLVANTLELRHRAVNSSMERAVQKERTRVGLMIAETLQGNKSASPESITESLALALNDLSQAARDVSLAAARMEAASVGIDSLSPRIENLNGRITDLDHRFAKDVVKSVDSLVASVSTLGVAMGGDMQKFVADVLAGLEEVNDGFKKTFVAVEFGTKQLRDDLDAIHRKLRP